VEQKMQASLSDNTYFGVFVHFCLSWTETVWKTDGKMPSALEKPGEGTEEKSGNPGWIVV
jgi:hypothetical protein